MRTHPYVGAPAYTRWDTGVVTVPPADVDPVVEFPLQLTRDDAIVTAGGCFAQHIARYLKEREFNFLVTEPGHPMLRPRTREEFNYGVFSARYGNIYTSRQLVQLVQRAYGDFTPAEDVWAAENMYFDPFRPTIQPHGFPTLEEYRLDREQHFAAVRRALETLDVFIFTFGLTECWASRIDGAVYPLAPGVRAGAFDPERHVFVNLGPDEVIQDMREFVSLLRNVNPTAQVILMVSPVPLFATAVDRHVLVSAAYSKAVLRVAAEGLVDSLAGVHYFPAYEIVTGNISRGAYFAEDLRSIRESGVQHFMSLFFAHVTADGPDSRPRVAAAAEDAAFAQEMEDLVGGLCDDELIGLQQE